MVMNANKHEHVHLGCPINDDVWMITVADKSGKALPVAFTKEQAIEIGRRITEWCVKDNLKPMTEWQPIETCPEDKDVLLYQPRKEEAISEAHGGGAYTTQSEGMVVGSIERNVTGIPIWVTPSSIGGWEMECDVQNPTHWMLLPEPPK